MSHRFLLPVFSSIAGTLSTLVAFAAPMAVTNPDFEQPALASGASSSVITGWSDAGTDNTKRRIEFVPGFNNGGNQHLSVDAGWEVWQDVPGVFYEPHTIYALKVAAGNRSGSTQPGNVSSIRMTNPAATESFLLNLNASTLPAGTFGQMIRPHNTALTGAGVIGSQLRLKLESNGAGRSHFDNVRLSSCGTFTGGDPGEGLDLEGEFAYAVNVGGGATGQIGSVNFTADNVAGVTFTGATQTDTAWPIPDLGSSTEDTRLETLMRSIRATANDPGTMTITLANLQPGRAHKLQLLFVEKDADRAMDVQVDGVPIFDDFRLLDFGPAGTPLAISHTFVPAAVTATIVLEGATAPAGLTRTPILCGFTLERLDTWSHPFNGQTRPETQTFGHATFTGNDVRLSQASAGQTGSLVVQNLSGTLPVNAFDVSFDAFAGNGTAPPADGYCFCWGNVPAEAFGEEGPAGFTGLVVSFDYYLNEGETQKEVTVKWNGVQIGAVPFDAHTSAYAPVHIRLRPGGQLDVRHGTTQLFQSLTLPGPPVFTSPRWGFGARTGSLTAEHKLDNLHINPFPFVVTTTADGGPGSLREALITAASAARPGPDQIHFAQALAGQTITLSSADVSTGAQTVTVDASMLGGGITLSGGGTHRIFYGNAGGNVFLRKLTCTGGNGVGVTGAGGGAIHSSLDLLTLEECQLTGNTSTGGGGAIYKIQGHLVLSRCTLSGNLSGSVGGGAIQNSNGTLSLSGCTLSGNRCSSGSGGAVYSTGGMEARQCTFTANVATNGGGGAILASGNKLIDSCTISGNSAPGSQGGGGYFFSTTILTDSIVAGNSSFMGADIHNGGSFQRSGVNLIRVFSNQQTGSDTGPAAINADPKLLPLGDYGGPTQTMPPAAGSPALDRVASPAFTTDQRGLPRVMWGKADIGAVEAGVQADCAWEVREFFRSPATALNTLADAEALVADLSATVISSTAHTINHRDPDAPGGGGFFPNDAPFASDNRTPTGLTTRDDDDFVLVARTFITVPYATSYTFGFSSDDGARLRIHGATFVSSTRLNGSNPANPAHSGDTLSYPGLTGNADTLGVCFLQAGTYPVEFLAWDRSGGAYCEVFAAVGIKTALDTDFQLLGDLPNGFASFTTGGILLASDPDDSQSGGFTVSSVNGPFEGPWILGGQSWATRGQGPELGRAPSTMLTSPPVAICQNGNVYVRFSHRYSFEQDFWDGGQLQLSVNGGPFSAVTTFDGGGYNGSVRSNSPSALHGQNAFVETSLNYNAGLPVSSRGWLGNLRHGDTVQIRFVAAYDSNTRNGDPAWEIFRIRVEQAAGWDVTVIRAGANSLNTALDQVFASWSGTSLPNTSAASAARINYFDPQNGGGGHGQTQTAFPGDSPGDDSNFALGARTTVTVSQDNEYTFCLLGDDSMRFRIKGSRGWAVSGGASPVSLIDGFQTSGCCADAFGHVMLREGTHELELIYNEIGGGAYCGLWVAPGRHTVFSPVIFSQPGVLIYSSPLSTGRQPGVPDRPLNDAFAQAFTLAGNTARGASCNTGATIEPGELDSSFRTKSVWWTWTAPVTGTFQMDTMGSNFNTILTVFRGNSLSALTMEAFDDNSGGDFASKLTFAATAGTAYRIQVCGWLDATGLIQLSIGPPPATPPAPANDNFASPLLLTGSTPAASGNTTFATAQTGEPGHAPEDAGYIPSGSVWFTWTAPFSGDFEINTFGSRFDTAVSVYTGNALTSLVRAASRVDGEFFHGGVGGYFTSRRLFTATAGITYRIALDGANPQHRGEYFLSIAPSVASILGHAFTPAAPPVTPGHTFMLRWRSEPWTTYRIEQSSDLQRWDFTHSCTASEGTSTDLDITGIPVNIPRLFFRVKRE